MIIRSLRSGITRVWTNKRMIFPFYLANLVFGLLIMLPLGYVLDDFVGHSMMRERIGEAMDYNFLFEFLQYAGSGLASVKGMLFTVPFAYWLAALFLSGGALAIFAGGKRYSPSTFWGEAAAHFGRFIRLTLMAIPLLIALFCLRYVVSLVQWLLFGGDPYGTIIYWGAWAKMALGFFGLILFGLIFDYARIHLVLTDNRKVRESLWHGARFAAKNPKNTLGLAFLLFAAGWLAVLAYYLTSNLFAAPGWILVIALLIWQQLYIVFRMALRLTAYSSQMELYHSVSP
jgi:hypothetical protein